MRVHRRVLVVEADDKADRHEVLAAFGLAHAVDPAAAERLAVERVAHRVHDEARRALARGHFPHFLDADAVDLRVLAFELQVGDQLLRHRAAAAFGEHDELAREDAAGLERALLLAVLVDARVLQLHAGDAIAFAHELRAGEAGEHLDALLLRDAAEPLHHLVEADDEVAVVLQRRRRDGELEPAVLGEPNRIVVVHFGFDRRLGLHRAPVGDQRIEALGIHDRAGDRMRADLGGLLDQHHLARNRLALPGLLDLGVVPLDQVLEVDRRGHARRAAADDHDVEFHHIAFSHGLDAQIAEVLEGSPEREIPMRQGLGYPFLGVH